MSDMGDEPDLEMARLDKRRDARYAWQGQVLHEQPMLGSPAATARAEEYSASTIPALRPKTLPFSPSPTPVRRPPEPEQGTVIGFTKHYHEDGDGYSFTAIRATNRHAGWFLSGPKHTGQPVTWDALLDFVGGPVEWARIGVVIEWGTLEDL